MTQRAPTPDVSYQTALRLREPLNPPAQSSPLPGDVQSQVNLALRRLTAADGRYAALSQGFTTLWEESQYPVAYRQARAQELLTQTFLDIDADLQAAADHIRQARDMARKGLTPPQLGTPDVHELKLLNAREEVRTALEGLQPAQQLTALVDLFNDAIEGDLRAPIAYFIAATDAYKRLLKDPAARAEFAYQQPALLRRILPPGGTAYFEAQTVLDELQVMLDSAQTTRHFVARDNGLPA